MTREASEKMTKGKTGMCALCVRVHLPNLIRVHEELNELAADHSELSGLRVIQRQPRVQLTTGLIKVQQPPHKPAHTASKYSKVRKVHHAIKNALLMI